MPKNTLRKAESESSSVEAAYTALPVSFTLSARSQSVNRFAGNSGRVIHGDTACGGGAGGDLPDAARGTIDPYSPIAFSQRRFWSRPLAFGRKKMTRRGPLKAPSLTRRVVNQHPSPKVPAQSKPTTRSDSVKSGD
jgi:hypothetical protein